ncbi:hypothetical protein S40285_09291 [Stachybotrys chlorohalonatus IBT 40285]|uniref:BZIP domain-containing protein n=2 Tax=Stachybotrys TaxID=74721 RepID=A0A084R266_STAC4|nr:hypothetical protein S7711_09526 [Stachybotrys chartarum IBT 7711]KFA52365.1 hypothetical protein S40293_09861 [Stachybotrys chartarum IBT 40293]KFA70301.1 hypothetical protein S40285_09291 [Stachybotrys chlorohalonata IBT 40285]
MTLSVFTRQLNAGVYEKEKVNIGNNQDILVEPLLGKSYADAFTSCYADSRSTLQPDGENSWGRYMPYDNKLTNNEYSENQSQLFQSQGSPQFGKTVDTTHYQPDFNVMPLSPQPQDETDHRTHLTRAAARNYLSASSSPSPALPRVSRPSSAFFVRSTLSSASSRDQQQQTQVPQSQRGHTAPKGKPRTRKRIEPTESVEEPQRNQFLERNRVAASKCRQKKKEWAQNLKDTKSMLEVQNKELHSEYDELLEQVIRMKNSLLCHATCDDPIIDRWIEVEARKYVEKLPKHTL